MSDGPRAPGPYLAGMAAAATNHDIRETLRDRQGAAAPAWALRQAPTAEFVQAERPMHPVTARFAEGVAYAPRARQ